MDAAAYPTGVRRFGGCAFLAIAMILAAGAGGAAADPEREIDLWPIFYYRSAPARRERVVEVIWPFLEWRREAETSHFFFRPFYNRRNFVEQRRVETEFLYPFGFGTFTPERRERWFWPLFLAGSRDLDEEEQSRRFFLLPLIIWKGGPDAPDDFMAFPIFGNLHRTAGKDRIVFVLWPIYTQDRKDTDRGWTVLFPFFRYERREDGAAWKLWPLFGRAYRRGKNAKTFVLWPFYSRQWANLKQGGRWQSLCIFPFYGTESSPAGRSWTVLWPFFKYTSRKQEYETAWYAPWPFLGRISGEQRRGHQLWPLYTYRAEPPKGRSRLILLWPFVWLEKEKTPETAESAFRILPLFWWARKQTSAGKGRLLQVWPLFKVFTEPDGFGHAEAPSILPLRWRDGWERNYAPFFRLFEWRREANGDRRWSILWRLLRWEAGEGRREFDIWPLISWRRREGGKGEADVMRLSLLKGLMGYRRAGNRREVRLLYLIRLPWGPEAAPEESPEGEP